MQTKKISKTNDVLSNLEFIHSKTDERNITY